MRFQAAKPGDATLNGVVDGGDLSVMGSHWQQQGVGWTQGDFNGDGVVNAGDLSLLGQNWGVHPQIPSAPVPEPVTLLLLSVAGMPLLEEPPPLIFRRLFPPSVADSLRARLHRVRLSCGMGRSLRGM